MGEEHPTNEPSEPTGPARANRGFWILVSILVAAGIGVAIAAGGDTDSTDSTGRAGPSSGPSNNELAGFACSELEDGKPESVIVPWLGSQAEEHASVDLREVLRLIENRCPELLE